MRRVSNPWARLGWDAWLLGAEAATVMALRGVKIATGGDPNGEEARRMVTEKVEAAQALRSLALTGASGVTALSVSSKALKHYRRRVALKSPAAAALKPRLRARRQRRSDPARFAGPFGSS